MNTTDKSKQQTGKDYSWIWAIIVVAIFSGFRICTNILEQSNKRRLEELVENCGGYDNFRKILSDDEDTNASPKKQVPQLELTPEIIELLSK